MKKVAVGSQDIIYYDYTQNGELCLFISREDPGKILTGKIDLRKYPLHYILTYDSMQFIRLIEQYGGLEEGEKIPVLKLLTEKLIDDAARTVIKELVVNILFDNNELSQEQFINLTDIAFRTGIITQDVFRFLLTSSITVADRRQILQKVI